MTDEVDAFDDPKLFDEEPKLRCYRCSEVTEFICRTCKRPFCAHHMSDIDPDNCGECVHSLNTSVKSEELVDSNGVRHNGRQIKLVGETWIRQQQVIANMTVPELEGWLRALKDSVHEAEVVLDYRRIMKSHVENELEERQSKKLSRLRTIRNISQTHQQVSDKASGAKTSSSTSENISDAMKMLGKLGLSKDQVAQLLVNLAKQKGKS